MGVRRFEDLLAWQKARKLVETIYGLTREGRFASDYALVRQVQRAAVSVPSNIAEGFERYRPGEYHQFLSIAKASCAELRSQLYTALDAGYLDRLAFDAVMADAEEVGRLVGSLRATVERRMRDTL